MVEEIEVCQCEVDLEECAEGETLVCITEINDETGQETEECNCEVDTNECKIDEEKVCKAEQVEDGTETESCEC